MEIDAVIIWILQKRWRERERERAREREIKRELGFCLSVCLSGWILEPGNHMIDQTWPQMASCGPFCNSFLPGSRDTVVLASEREKERERENIPNVYKLCSLLEWGAWFPKTMFLTRAGSTFPMHSTQKSNRA